MRTDSGAKGHKYGKASDQQNFADSAINLEIFEDFPLCLDRSDRDQGNYVSTR
jgi:hypothetical protein